MIELDLTALRTRFFSDFGANDPQVTWLGKPNDASDQTKPWCRFVIEPGAGRYIEQGGPSKLYEQQGVITLSVYVPKNKGEAQGYALIEKFADLFRDWSTADGALYMGASRRSSPAEVDNSILYRIRFDWTSHRRS